MNGIWPAQYDCKGNHIKDENLAWARKAVNELVQMGSVARWDDFTKDFPEYARGAQPRMVMSLIVTPKGNKPNQWRLCHDARPLNKLLLKQKFRMARLEDFLKQLARGDCLFTLDIESAYHHVEVNPRFCTLLGFELDGIFYVYRCLPFGLVTSAQVFCALTEVTAQAVRESELVTALICYVDDFGGSVGQEPDHARMQQILALVRSFGWVLAPSKLVIGLEQEVQLLGFVLNTVRMSVRVPTVRRLKLLDTAAHVLTNRDAVQARIVCKLIGQILSMRLALGLICRLRSRYLMLTVKPAATAGRYNMTTSVHGRALDELMLWCDTASSLGESPMQPHLRPIDYTIEADASDHALGAIVVSAPARRSDLKGMEIYRRLQPHETKWGSLLREMTGYRDAVYALEQEAKLADKVVEIVGDAQSAKYIFANGGSQVQDPDTKELLLLETLLDIVNLGAAKNFEVRFRWVPREQLQDADDLSKMVDRMDFSLAPEVLAYVLRAYGPVTIDAFAAPHNHVVPRFFARYGAVAAEARDAFAQDWSSGALFVLPDFHVLGNVLDRIERDNAVVVLIVPEWTHHAWWHRLWSGAWAQRRGVYEFLPGSVLVSNNEHTFFGTRFTSRVLVMRTTRARPLAR